MVVSVHSPTDYKGTLAPILQMRRLRVGNISKVMPLKGPSEGLTKGHLTLSLFLLPAASCLPPIPEFLGVNPPLISRCLNVSMGPSLGLGFFICK